jgi:hypothetical protein
MAQERWQQLASQHSQKMGPPPPQPGSPEAAYQAFMAAIQNDVKLAAEQLLAKVVETAALGTVPPAGAAVQPVPVAGPAGPHEGHVPPKGHPMDPRSAPVAGNNPSISSAPAAAQGGPGVSDQERAAAQFEARATT